MDIRFEDVGDAVLVTPDVKRLDALVAADCRRQVVERVAGRLVVLDLEKVTFMDSSGLGALVSVMKSVPPGGQLRLVHAADSVRTLLKLTRLDRVFPVDESREKSLGKLE